MERCLALLEQVASPLLLSSEARAQFTAQLYSVIDAVAAEAGVSGGLPSGGGDGLDLSEAIGRIRATSGIDPSQSLEAAALIFEAALPTMAARLAAVGDPTPELTAGRLLNAAILQRMAVAARAYVDYLLEKAYGSTRDEKRRLSVNCTTSPPPPSLSHCRTSSSLTCMPTPIPSGHW
ncbi:MAG: hypothetical protein M3N95_08330 [Actinomycetota bacterium]|nr:hypothetical protein [Actinomycetota bacterium]